jgi:hypothetical protein
MLGRSFGFVVAFAFALAPPFATAQSEQPTQRVTFKDGRGVIKGRIKGRQYVDYVFSAGAGEPLKASLRTSNASNYFNLLAPGETEGAFFVGSTSGNSYRGVAPTSGDYTARVYLMRSAARRGEGANYTLTLSLGQTSATDEKGPDFADGLTGGAFLRGCRRTDIAAVHAAARGVPQSTGSRRGDVASRRN